MNSGESKSDRVWYVNSAAGRSLACLNAANECEDGGAAGSVEGESVVVVDDDEAWSRATAFSCFLDLRWAS